MQEPHRKPIQYKKILVDEQAYPPCAVPSLVFREALKNVYGEELARQILFKNGLRRHTGLLV